MEFSVHELFHVRSAFGNAQELLYHACFGSKLLVDSVSWRHANASITVAIHVAFALSTGRKCFVVHIENLAVTLQLCRLNSFWNA